MSDNLERAQSLFAPLRAMVERNTGLAMVSTNSKTGVQALAREALTQLDNLERDTAALLDSVAKEARLDEHVKTCQWCSFHHEQECRRRRELEAQ